MRIGLTLILLALFTFSLVSKSCYATDSVRYNVSHTFSDPKQRYYIDLLRLALEKSVPEYGAYTLLEKTFEDAPQARTLELLANDDLIDVHWSMTSITREHKLGTVYIPLLKGMMGARVFIIHKDFQVTLNAQTHASALLNYRFGSGHDWPDSQIYTYNNLKTETAGAQNLLNMAVQKRFDLFPRALHEPWSEVTDYPSLRIDDQFGLCYPSAMYFFVKKSNHRLRKRLTHGLHAAMHDGSFDALFNAHPITKDAIQKGHFTKRKLLKLRNPTMSIRTRDTLNAKRYTWAPLHNCVRPTL